MKLDPKEKRTKEREPNDWFFDELMTAQPEATREFYRIRLLRDALATAKRGSS